MQERKQALFITSRIPYPPLSGGQIRMINDLRMLAISYNVHLLCFSYKELTSEIRGGLETLVQNVVHIRVSRISYIWNLVRALFTGLPFQVELYNFSCIRIWIRKHWAEYETLFCMHVRTATYAQYAHCSIKAIDYVDAISMNYKNASKQVLGFLKWFYRFESARLLQYEVSCSHEFEKRMITSKKDKDFLETYGAADIAVIPHSILSEANNGMLIEGPGQDDNLLFIGAMWYEPNVTAVKYFCSNIWPPLKLIRPNINLFVVGARPTKEILELKLIDGVHIEGYVDNIDSFLYRAAVIIAPMLSGSGVQTKIVEAFSRGKCVMATSLACDGLGNIDSEAIVVVDGVTSWVDELKRLASIEGRSAREAIGARALNYYRSNFSLSAISRDFVKYLQR